MKFAEWREKQGFYVTYEDVWNAAQAEMKERCANKAVNMSQNWDGFDIAAAIRAIEKEKLK